MIQIKTLCEGCKHWHRADSDYAKKKGGLCYDTYEYDPEPPLIDLSVGLCSLAKHEPSSQQYAGWEGDQPSLLDGSGYFAAMWTKATYGCVMSEPLPAPGQEGGKA